MKVVYRTLNRFDLKPLKEAVGFCLTEHTRGFAAVDEETQRVLARVVFENWTPTCVTVHWAIYNPMVLRHGLLEEVAHYAFVVGGRIKIVSPVPSNNEKALRLNRHLGFTEVARIEDMFDHGVAGIIVELHKDDCKYLNMREYSHG